MYTIKIQTPTELKSAKFIAGLTDLAKRGIHSNEIRLQIGFISSDPEAIFKQFRVLKNKIYFQLDNQ